MQEEEQEERKEEEVENGRIEKGMKKEKARQVVSGLQVYGQPKKMRSR